VIALAEDIVTSRYELGAGFSTDSALRLRFNRDTPLLNEHGHSLRIESEFSEPRQAVEALYRIPHHDPLDDILELTAGMQGKNVQDTDSLTATTGVRHAIKVFEDWSFGYGASVELERYTIASQSEAGRLPAARCRHLAGGLNWRITRSGSAVQRARLQRPRAGSPADFQAGAAAASGWPACPMTTPRCSRARSWAPSSPGFSNLPPSLRFTPGATAAPAATISSRSGHATTTAS
jgi:hypothetical protein